MGDHGWFDKRLIYEQSFQMPLLIRYPRQIPASSINNDIVTNVDFAPTFLDLARYPIPNYMQGRSFLTLLRGDSAPEDWQRVAYHRYWMHNDSPHECRAHYGVRGQRYKIIYWCGQQASNPVPHMLIDLSVGTTFPLAWRGPVQVGSLQNVNSSIVGLTHLSL